MSSRRTSVPPPVAQGIEALVLDALSAEVCLINREGTILAVNKAWRDFARANHADETRVLEGENYLAVCDAAVGPEAGLAQAFGQGIRAVLAGERSYFELEYPCPSPEKARWFVGRVTLLRFKGAAFAVIAHEDVTERKMAKDSLIKTLRQLRTIMDTVPDLLYELDLDSNLVGWNKRFEEVSGYSPEELKGRNALDFFSPEEKPLIAQAIQQKLAEGYSTVEGHLLTKDGRAILFQWAGSVQKDEQGRTVGASGMGRDISSQRKAEVRLRQSEASLSAAQHIAHLGSWEWDLATDRIAWSSEMVHILGLQVGQLKPTFEAFLEHVHPEDRTVVRQSVAQATRGARLFEHNLRIIRPSGAIRTLHSQGEVILDASGKPVRMVGVTQDVTERESLALQLKEQYEQLKELDRLKGNFVNAVTHELRTPLTSIMGYAEFLEDGIGGPLTPEQLTYVHEQQRGAKRLENLLNDLLDFAKFEAGTFKLTLREDDLAEKILESVDSLRPQAKEAQLQLIVTLPDEPICVRMDQQRIGQILINLIGNAIKFTPPGGIIEVRASLERDQVLCEVMDTGIGVAHEDLPKLFQRFMQLDPGVRKGIGAGLGLSISKAIVDAHGGRIGVKSRLDEGSTFWFTLPLRGQVD